jgi:hypothetical protein
MQKLRCRTPNLGRRKKKKAGHLPAFFFNPCRDCSLPFANVDEMTGNRRGSRHLR